MSGFLRSKKLITVFAFCGGVRGAHTNPVGPDGDSLSGSYQFFISLLQRITRPLAFFHSCQIFSLSKKYLYCTENSSEQQHFWFLVHVNLGQGVPKRMKRSCLNVLIWKHHNPFFTSKTNDWGVLHQRLFLGIHLKWVWWVFFFGLFCSKKI